MLTRAGAITRRYGLTAARMDAALAQLTEVLQEFNCRATLPVTATALSRNRALAQKMQALGMELAVHGFTHVDHTQLSLEQQRDQLRRAKKTFELAEVPFSGFRSPYLRWNTDTLTALSECGFDYDSSQALAWDVIGGAETDAYRHVLAFYDARMAAEYPSLPRLAGSLVRIPYCLPDDEALVERLKLPAGKAMAEIWLAMLERIYAAGELFTLGLHPERISECKDALRMVLAKARSLSPTVWIARLDEISAWYRSLGQVTFRTEQLTSGCWRINLHAPSGAGLLARSVDTEAPTRSWGKGYQRVLSNELVFRGERFPWIGLPPDHPSSLERFLRHQGYLVEIGANPQAFSYFFERKTFENVDERPLLAVIETGNRPLLRLGRWPDGAQAALAVTGDVDAFTLWDYSFRTLGR